MRISILVPDAASNSLGRGYLLARVLSRHYDIELIGPVFGSRIWPPCDTGEFDYKTVPGAMWPMFLSSARKLIALITGDVIYASKPLTTSYGVALLGNFRQSRPLVLDIDDWETGLLMPKGRFDWWRTGPKRIRRPNSILYVRQIEKLIPLAAEITVASDFLQARYGGVKVPHGRDTDFLDPTKYESGQMRVEMGLGNYRYIVFLGTPRPHKGLNVLVEAIRILDMDDLKLLIIGAGSGDAFNISHSYLEQLICRQEPFLEIRGFCPFSDIPRYLSVADMVVVPQLDVPGTRGQVPAKLFDAMAMARPIIASAVSEIPKILDGCGIVVESGNAELVAEKILYVLEHEEEAFEMGKRAREKCVQEYSWQAMDAKLRGIFDRYER